jgi:tetratricopeptide (TPR) repeat protein
LPVAPLPASEPTGSQPSAERADTPGDSSTQAGADPKSAQIWNELGNIYYNIVAYDEAINALNKALELDHSYGWTYNNLASIYIHKGSYAEAIPLLQKGIPLLRDSKDKALLWNRLGDAYRRLDQPDQAAEAYKKAVELDPENVSLLTRARFSLLGNCRA